MKNRVKLEKVKKILNTLSKKESLYIKVYILPYNIFLNLLIIANKVCCSK